MGIYTKVKDFDKAFEQETHKIATVVDYDKLTEHELFRRSGQHKKRVVVNTLSDTSSEEKDYINENIYTQYTNDNSIDIVPTCQCTMLVGRFQLGRVCPNCGTEVSNKYDNSVESLIWLKTPKDIPAMINPIVWTMLCKRFMAEFKFDTIRWLCDTNYIPPNGKPPIIHEIENMKLGRGLINFYNRFDEIMDVLFDLRALRDTKTKETGVDDMRTFVKENRNVIFCQYIPMPNKILMVVEKTNFGTYLDPNITGAMDALWSMAGIDNEFSNLKLKQKENRTIKAINLLAEYHSNIIKKVYMSKEGVLRDHLYATRTNFAFRCVISSQTNKHKYNCISVPWGVAVTSLRFILVNKLTKRGYAPKEIESLLTKHQLIYHPLLDELFKEIIEEHKPYDGIPCIGVRYPSLKRGSMQLFYINEVKTDTRDITVSLSILVIRPLNADFDGDAMSFYLPGDVYLTEGMRTLEPHFSAFKLSEPGQVSGDLVFPKPLLATVVNWFHYQKPIDPNKRELMKQLIIN